MLYSFSFTLSIYNLKLIAKESYFSIISEYFCARNSQRVKCDAQFNDIMILWLYERNAEYRFHNAMVTQYFIYLWLFRTIRLQCCGAKTQF